MKFKKGDVVESFNTGYSLHKWIKGYIVKHTWGNLYKVKVLEADDPTKDFINEEWSFRESELELIERSKEMNLKDRIEALTGWDKEADDILQEMRLINVRSGQVGYCWALTIPFADSESIRITSNRTDTSDFEAFPYNTQYQKLQAFKDALLWLAEKAGKLDDKKDKAREEIAELRERINKLEEQL